ncbi:hypothetical protein EAH76_19460 [Sphingomonas glacialis]|uniref:Uncharacterized protein n=1 Tax=Sphingomonas glacialis TaxID=658225 RepID=A0A502FHU1_9SPHN|nr:hypothetical protein EAH76_19460 [Sphingomonas glacialis]
MASASTQSTKAEDAGLIAALVIEDGIAGHSLLRRLATPGAAGRDLADAVHALCSVHGRLTDVFEEAAQRSVAALDNRWIAVANAAFQDERAYLAHLTAAVGPLPSTPGQAESDAAFAALRHTFDMLARSDRAGCSTGAALALVIDWHAFRTILDAAAHRAGSPVTPSQLPALAETESIAVAHGANAAVRRAMAFGAQQTFAQHRGLCDLIEARANARDRL